MPEKPKEQNRTLASKRNFARKFLKIFTTATFVVLVFIVGVAFGSSKAVPGSSDVKFGKVKNTDSVPKFLQEDVDFNQFWNVWEYVKNYYVDSDVAETKLFYGAISGLVQSLGDPYSVYFDPEISAKFEQELSGSFEGIGAEIGIRDSRLTIIAPLPGTPAEKSGLQAKEQ